MEYLDEQIDPHYDPDCPDTEWLGYDWSPDGTCMGYIESVNGSGCGACWDFPATRHEMTVIARHWYRELKTLRAHKEACTCDSSEWRTEIYAQRRLKRIRRLLGDERFDRAIAEVEAESPLAAKYGS